MGNSVLVRGVPSNLTSFTEEIGRLSGTTGRPLGTTIDITTNPFALSIIDLLSQEVLSGGSLLLSISTTKQRLTIENIEGGIRDPLQGLATLSQIISSIKVLEESIGVGKFKHGTRAYNISPRILSITVFPKSGYKFNLGLTVDKVDDSILFAATLRYDSVYRRALNGLSRNFKPVAQLSRTLLSRPHHVAIGETHNKGVENKVVFFWSNLSEIALPAIERGITSTKNTNLSNLFSMAQFGHWSDEAYLFQFDD